MKTVVHLNIERFDTKENYTKITTTIEKNYKLNNKFDLVIETKNLSSENISIKYLYKFGNWLNNMKKNVNKSLNHTTIKIYDNSVYDILYLLFIYLSSPIAPVDVILYKNNEIEKIQKFYP